MKILTAAQLAEADQATLKSQNISSTDLMERVSTLVFNKIHERLNGAPVPVKIFCGIGNNGGDGLAIARHMIQHGYHVTTYVTNCSKKRSKDFLVNYDKVKEVTKDWPILLDCEEDIPEISPKDIVIDAIFGIGLNRPVKGWMASLFNRTNDSGAFTVSIDMPSGLFSDTAQPADSAVIQADHTFTFNSPKLSFFLEDTGNYTGTFEVLNIGLDPTFIHQADPAAMLITRESAQNIYRPRKKFSHKGDYGHVLVMAGSKGKIGAAVLASTAAINSGAGKVTAYVPSCGNDILQSSVPEVMTIADSGVDQLNDFKTELEKYILCVGPGIGTSDEVVSAFAKAIKLQSSPVLIDADGINILAANIELLKDVPAKSILTPHDGELERLLGGWDSSMERLDKAREFSMQHDVILVLKGAHSITVYKDHMYINDSGNAGMATAGSGDVLSGIISSFMAQSYDPLMAAVFGAYIHGASGDIAAQTYAHEGLRAGIISNFVGPAILQLFRQENK
ncbi:NAD(P)H-hydrate dehydratase [Nonlabens agnitus]|uniref:Bifunctional NAD(P)H-hydrate repair enzyme n=1 Tax=Nonlabens agnitus TaxID=870484 RepID=A0A2S9WTR6_9FLAO|nr:NAD(P)H-hydrate dehydratase [Nonlabens agnitus]PRP66873.1 carbohydrate kinase [Nonlabens agnitus]